MSMLKIDFKHAENSILKWTKRVYEEKRPFPVKKNRQNLSKYNFFANFLFYRRASWSEHLLFQQSINANCIKLKWWTVGCCFFRIISIDAGGTCDLREGNAFGT